MILVTNITGYTQCPTTYTAVFRCPSQRHFPAHNGCGEIIRQYGFEITGASTIRDLINRINQIDSVAIQCPHCNYSFKPSEVYL